MTELLKSYNLSSTSEISGLGDQLTALVKKHQLPESLAFDITLIVDELLSNSLKYGDGDNFELRVSRQPEALLIECRYNGAAFDPLAAEKPDLSLPVEQRSIGGVGLKLVTALSRCQKYSRSGALNCLELTLPIP